MEFDVFEIGYFSMSPISTSSYGIVATYVALTRSLITFSRGRRAGGGGGSDWRTSKDPYGADDDDAVGSSNWEKEFEVLKVQNKPAAPKVSRSFELRCLISS